MDVADPRGEMRSKASFKGHPIHPALIPFPLAFLFGAFAFDVAGVLTRSSHLWRTGGHLALVGIISALLAAVPGFVDYVYTVPPNSTGKRRATRHMMANLSAVALFVIATGLRSGVGNEPSIVLLILELAAIT